MLKWYDKRKFVPKYDIIKDCYKIIEAEFNKPVFLTKEDYGFVKKNLKKVK